MEKLISVILVFNLSLFGLSVQDKILLKEKPATIKTMSVTLNCQGPDQCWKSCGFTNSESDAATKNMLSLVDIFRQCPVLKTISRFDGICDMNGDDRCNTKFGYGLPTTIYFYFKSWSLRKGNEVRCIYEPTQFRFEVNMADTFCSNRFNVFIYSNLYNPTNPAFIEKGMENATVALRELFDLPGVKGK